MKIKTTELEGPALDWAVLHTVKDAKDIDIAEFAKGPGLANIFRKGYYAPLWKFQRWRPSTSWQQGGEVLRHAGINLTCWSEDVWVAEIGDKGEFSGKHPLIAAMRCYVASKLGDEVSVPDILLPLTKEGCAP